MAAEYMETHGFDLGMLHTGNAVDYYARFGWKSVPRSTIEFVPAKLAEKLEKTVSIDAKEIGKYEFNAKEPIDSEILHQIQAIYHQFCIQNKVVGSLCRQDSAETSSKEDSYWINWILRPMTDPRPKKDCITRYMTWFPKSAPKAYLVVGVRSDQTYVIREFAYVTLDFNPFVIMRKFLEILGLSLSQTVELPASVLFENPVFAAADLVTEHGTMYLAFPTANANFPSHCNAHMFLPSDSF